MKTAFGLLVLISCCAFPRTSARAKEPAVNAPRDLAGFEQDLPLPFGIRLLYFHQEQEYEVTGLRAFSGGFPVPGFGSDIIRSIESDVEQIGTEFDWWALPWLNLHATAGHVDGHATAGLSPLVQNMGLPPGLRVDYDGITYGGGATVATGYRNFFATMTVNYTWSDVDFNDSGALSLDDPSGIETLVFMPRIGFHNKHGALWAGAWYQATEHTQNGSFNLGLPSGPVQFAADVEDKTAWSYVVGGEWFLSKSWSVTAEAGFGERRQLLLGTTFRF